MSECPDCGRPIINGEQWMAGVPGCVQTGSDGDYLLSDCASATIARLRKQIADLEQQVSELAHIEQETAPDETVPQGAAREHGSLCGCGQCSGYNAPPCARCGAADHGLPACPVQP